MEKSELEARITHIRVGEGCRTGFAKPNTSIITGENLSKWLISERWSRNRKINTEQVAITPFD